jgi:hypothetical protein
LNDSSTLDFFALKKSDNIPNEIFTGIIDKHVTKLHHILMPKTIYLDEEIPPFTLKSVRPSLNKLFVELMNRPFDFNKPWYPVNSRQGYM